jgi:hypothetical protein
MRQRNAQQKREQKTVKTDFSLDRAYTRIKQLVILLVTSSIIYKFVFIVIHKSTSIESIYQLLLLSYQAYFLLIAPFVLLICSLLILSIPFALRYEQKRQAAASGNSLLLAVTQPLPDANALPLPYRIQEYPDWSSFLISLGMLPSGMGLLAFIWSQIYANLTFTLLLFTIAEMFAVGFCGFHFWILVSHKYRHILVTEEGMIQQTGLVGLPPTYHFISWKNARLLAICDASGIKKNAHMLFFEMADAHTTIHWRWIRFHNKHTLPFAPPAILPEEYDRQMQALLSLIVARTGLPLYDLRQHRRR